MRRPLPLPRARGIHPVRAGLRTRSAVAIAVVGLLVGGCGAAATPSPAPATSPPAPTAAPSPTDAPPATPAVTPSTPPAGIVLAMADVPRAAPGPDDLAAASAVVNRFALDLLHRQGGPANLVFSPSSIVTALAMARAGARGTTATEMDAVLGVDGRDALLAAVNALDIGLAARNGWVLDEYDDPPASKEIALRSVNASFGQVGYPIEEDYLAALAASFGAGQRLVDYRADPDGARRLVNAWVSDRTEERIAELLAKPDVTGLTRLILINAIYLKAPWLSPFRADETKPGPFTRVDGSTVTVPLMHLESTNVGPTFPAARRDGWAAVRLPYLGEQLAMTIIVPDDLAALEKKLDAALLAELTQTSRERRRIEGSDDEEEPAGLEDNRVVLTLPRFSIGADLKLADTLAAMGMPTAFDPANADFTGIARPDRTGELPLYVASVIHQANIDVDEKGTEAAAATAVVMATAGPGDQRTPIVVRADRPFLFVLTDVETGTVLFIGRVADPAAS